MRLSNHFRPVSSETRADTGIGRGLEQFTESVSIPAFAGMTVKREIRA